MFEIEVKVDDREVSLERFAAEVLWSTQNEIQLRLLWCRSHTLPLSFGSTEAERRTSRRERQNEATQL